MKDVLRILAYLRPYWQLQSLYLVCEIGYFGCLLTLPWIEKLLIDDVFNAGNADRLLPTCGLYLLLSLGTFGISFLGRYFHTKIEENAAKDFKMDAYHHLRKLGFHFYDSQQTGRTMALFESDIPTALGLQVLVGSYLIYIVQFLAAFIIVTSVSWQLCLFALFLVALNVMIPFILERTLRRTGEEIQEQRAELSGILQESIAGSRELKGLGKEFFDLAKIHRSLLYRVSLAVKYTIIQRIGSFNTMLFWIATASIFFVGGGYVLHSVITIGELFAVTRYFNHMYAPLEMLIRTHLGFPLNLAAARRVFAFFDEHEEESQDGSPITEIEGRIHFSNVSFGYTNESLVLKNITFTAEPGETIAVVGHSGAGKSTLIHLIPRFYQPQQGNIFIDTTPINDIHIQSLRSHIGLVFQDPYLFADTIAYNISIGAEDPDAVTLEEVVTAAKLANAHDFIVNFSKQYESKIGERGIRLSGGERQRIAIARVLIGDPKILILDEATAALDADSEVQVQAALTNLMKNRTNFVIAHRLSTVLNADKILVINDGRLVETGTHAELIQRGSVYHNLFQKQFTGMQADQHE